MPKLSVVVNYSKEEIEKILLDAARKEGTVLGGSVRGVWLGAEFVVTFDRCPANKDVEKERNFGSPPREPLGESEGMWYGPPKCDPPPAPPSPTPLTPMVTVLAKRAD